MKLSEDLYKQHDLATAAKAMKLCRVALVHKVKLNFETGEHCHKMRAILQLEGKQDQIDLVKWQAGKLTAEDNAWTTKL